MTLVIKTPSRWDKDIPAWDSYQKRGCLFWYHKISIPDTTIYKQCFALYKQRCYVKISVFRFCLEHFFEWFSKLSLTYWSIQILSYATGGYLNFSVSVSPSYAYSHGQFLFSAGLLRSHYWISAFPAISIAAFDWHRLRYRQIQQTQRAALV